MMKAVQDAIKIQPLFAGVLQTLTGDETEWVVIPHTAPDLATALFQKAVLGLPSLSRMLPEDLFLADDNSTIVIRPTINVKLRCKGGDNSDTTLSLATEHGLTLSPTKPITMKYAKLKVAIATGIHIDRIKLSVMHESSRIRPKPKHTLDTAHIGEGTVIHLETKTTKCSIQ